MALRILFFQLRRKNVIDSGKNRCAVIAVGFFFYTFRQVFFAIFKITFVNFVIGPLYDIVSSQISHERDDRSNHSGRNRVHGTRRNFFKIYDARHQKS